MGFGASETGLPGGADAAPGSQRFSLLRTAAPMVVSRAGLAAMTIVDCIMVARHDAQQLAATILSEGTFGRLADVFMAFLLSGLVLVAAAQGPHLKARRVAVWQRSLMAALGLGAAGLGIGLFAEPILAAIGQERALSNEAGAVIAMLGLGLPAGLVAVASAVYLEASGKAGRVAAFILLANLANVALNWLLIGGNLGLPEMGALGSATSTSIVRIGLAVALVIGVRALDGPAVFRRAPRYDGMARDQWRLGLSASGTSSSMHALGIWLTVSAGWLGSLQLSAYASGWMLNLPGLLLAIGIGDAMATRVARASESGASTREIGGIVRGDLTVLALILSPFVLTLQLAPTLVAALYTTDPVLAAAMVGLLPVTGLALMLDGLSYGAVAALRGRRDVAVPMAIQVACMAATPVLAAGLAFGLAMGVRGLVLAVLCTSTARLALLLLRLLHQRKAATMSDIQTEGFAT